MSAETAERFLTVPEFAPRVGISVRKAYGLVEDRVIGHHRHGDLIRIPESEVAVYLARTYVPAESGEAVA